MDKKIKVLIVVDGGEKIGLGHIVRTLALADELQNYDLDIFFLTKKDISSISLIKESGYQLSVLDQDLNENEEISQIIKKITKEDIDIVILDKITNNEDYYNSMKSENVFTVSLDNIRNVSLDIDLIINGGIYANEYFNTTNKNVLIGEKYFILRKQFMSSRKRLIKKNIEDILICMGGSDPLNITYPIVEEILKLEKIYKLNVVLGKGYCHGDKLDRLASRYSNINILRDSREMSLMMYSNDIAITAGGITLYELATTGTPALVIQQSDGQILPTKHFEEYGFAVNLGGGERLNKESIIDNILYLDSNRDERAKSSKIGMELIDGFGAIRCAEAIMSRYQLISIKSN